MKVKNDFCPMAKGKKAYNPNNFTKWDAGLAFLLFTLLFFGFMYLVRFIIRKTGFIEYLREDYAFSMVFSTLISQGFIFLFAFFYSKVRKVSFLTGGGYGFKWNTTHIFMGILLCVGILFIFESLHMQLSDDFDGLFGTLGINGGSSIPDDLNPGWVLLDVFILAPLLPAICEEGLMRSIIFRSLEGYGKVFAIICSGAMFAIFHGNYEQIILQFLGGMAFALVLCATKNFFISCAMHFSYNFLVEVISIYRGVLLEKYPGGYYVFQILSVFLGIAFLIISLTYFIKMINATSKKRENKAIKDRYKVYLYSLKNNSVTELYAQKTAETQELIYDENCLLLRGNYFISANKSDKKILPAILLTLSIVVGVVFIFI